MRHWRLLIGLLVSAATLYWLARNVPLDETVRAIGRSHPGWLAAAVAMIAATMVVKAYRWGLLFYPVRGLRLESLVSAIFIGYLISTIIPARVGELVRAYLITETEPVDLGRSLATIVVEKLLDVGAVLLLLGVVALFLPLPDLVARGAQLAALSFLALLVAIGLAAWRRRDTVRLVQRLQPRLPGPLRRDWTEAVDHFLDGLAIFRGGRHLARLTLSSILIWVMGGLTDFLVLTALHVPDALLAAYLLLAITNLGMVVPSAPGYVGTFQLLTVTTFGVLGIEESLGGAVGIVLWVVIFGSFIVGGVFFLWRGKYRAPDLWSRSRSVLQR